MLERSKGAGLVVRSNIHSYSPDHVRVLFLQEVLTKHAPRIRELDLYGIEPPTLTTLFENLEQSSLRLRSCKIACSIKCAFPIGVLDIGELRHLAISNCDCPWFSWSLPALTNLSLCHIPTRPSLLEFLEFLCGLPALEVLVMDDSLPLASDLVCSIGPIELPHLSHLRLSSTTDWKEVTNILPVIIVPPAATLCFNAGLKQLVTSHQLGIILDKLASSFSTFFGQDTDLPYSKLRALSTEKSHLRLEAWKDDGSVSLEPDLDLTLYLPTRALSHSAQNMLQSIFPSLPLFYITTLTLDLTPVYTLLEDTFGQLPRLQNVKVNDKCISEFTQALTRNINYSAENSADSSILFPALRSLWIDFSSFKGSGTCTVEDLQNCLMERYERRVGLLKLKLTNCHGLRDQDVESLRDIVSDVEWDGIVQGADSDHEESEFYSEDDD